ncbi:restriction endonuclease subunit S [Kordia periserrulae]|nr:restriction endonuclease subunit S [Kordia periserrulae]
MALRELINDTIDYRGKTPPKCDSGVAVVSAANIKKGKIILDGKYLSLDLYEKWTTRGFIKPGDILITTEAPVGEIARVPDDRTYLTSRRVFALQVNEEVANETFIYYYLLTEGVKRYFESISHGATVPRIYKDEILDLKINLPPLPTQQKIASILSAYDDLIENNNKRIQLLEEMASEIYKEWFVRLRFPNYQDTSIENGVPEGWEKKRLKDLIVFEKGKNPKEIYEDEVENSMPYLNMDAIDKGGKSWVSIEKQIVVNKSDVIMVMDGSRSSLVFRGKEGAVGNTLSKLRFTDDEYITVKNTMLYHFLKLNHKSIKTNNTGSAIPHANKKYIHSLSFLIPSDDIMDDFNKSVVSIHELIDNLYDKNNFLQQTRDLLLPRLISGKLEL